MAHSWIPCVKSHLYLVNEGSCLKNTDAATASVSWLRFFAPRNVPKKGGTQSMVKRPPDG